jgi:hypothetical protein
MKLIIHKIVFSRFYAYPLCSRDLPTISNKVGWGRTIGYNSTGRAMREIIEPMEKGGLFSELRDENDKFVGYVLTDTGRRAMLGEK